MMEEQLVLLSVETLSSLALFSFSIFHAYVVFMCVCIARFGGGARVCALASVQVSSFACVSPRMMLGLSSIVLASYSVQQSLPVIPKT